MNRPRKSKSLRGKKKTSRKGFAPSSGRNLSFRSESQDRVHHSPRRELSKQDRKKVSEAYAITRDKISGWFAEAETMRAQAPKQFNLDPWQQQAVDALMDGKHVVVDAPTTAGKTRVVEAFFQDNLHDPSFRACYTCPVKSLSNDKVKEFRKKFGKGYVGIATGDIKENLDAPIVVATLESYRNSLLGVEPDLGRSLVVFDEYHYIQDEGRGSAWEEAIILTPPACQILMLSASVANPDEFALWLEKISNRPSVLISVDERPVPLCDLIWFDGRWIMRDELPKSALPRKLPKEPPLPSELLTDPLKEIEQMNLTPCLVYGGKRLSCDLIAHTLSRSLYPLPPDEQKLLRQKLDEADDSWGSYAFLDKELERMIIRYGVAYHHSGLAPAVRLAIEYLIKNGDLRFCVATMGLSLGINFSVRSTVISDFSRPGESGMTPYSPSEVLQMTGRAGRRGLDVIGYSCWLSPFYAKRMSFSHRNQCQSRLKTDAATFIGLQCRGMNLQQVESFYKKSLLKMQNPQVNMNLVTPKRLAKKLKVNELPCQSPLAERGLFRHKKTKQDSMCSSCSLRKACHSSIVGSNQGFLAKLHEHLHRIGALERDGRPSTFGRMARFFPQNGGLVLAWWMFEEKLPYDDHLKLVELLASLTLARFKEPRVPSHYSFSIDEDELHEELKTFYPIHLFPELYDTNRSGALIPYLREFNPLAGWALREWLQGRDWDDLVGYISSRNFGVGDLTGLIYRVASYLQSIHQSQIPYYCDHALDMRRELLRKPVHILL